MLFSLGMGMFELMLLTFDVLFSLGSSMTCCLV
jgi:hypothetical protein